MPTTMRSRPYLIVHHLLTVALAVLVVVAAFAAGWVGGVHHESRIQYNLRHFALVPSFVAPGVKAVPILPRAPQLVENKIYEVPLGGWEVKTDDQGTVGSCESWTTAKIVTYGYNRLTGRRIFITPRPYYSADTHGQDRGSSPDEYPPLYAAFGAVVWSRFPYGVQRVYNGASYPAFADDVSLPSAVTVNKLPIHFTVNYLFTNAGSGEGGLERIESAILAGQPVSIGIPVYNEYENAGPGNTYIGMPGPHETSYGGHANTILAFYIDKNGQIWFLVSNQWTFAWGGLNKYGHPSATAGGYAWLSGAFLAQYGFFAATLQVTAA